MSNGRSKIIGAIQYLLLRLLTFISHLLKSLWVFFPGIIFIVLALWCFWTLGQGKDLVVAFTENHKAKAFFFIAIAFWVYVSWYSSRVVAYLKLSKQEDYIKKLSEGQPVPETATKLKNAKLYSIPPSWLDIFPRIIGYGCLLSIEIAVLLSPALGNNAIDTDNAMWYFFLGIIVCWSLDNQMKKFAESNRSTSRRIFYCLLVLFLIAATVVIMYKKGSILLLLWVLLVLHAVFLFYINLRREEVESPTKPVPQPFILKHIAHRLMDFLSIPRKETGYFYWFNLVCLVGLFIYLLSIWSLKIAWQVGPFPFVLLAFAVLGGFANIITVLSVKARVNFHFLLWVIALLLGSKETHNVRTKPMTWNLRKGIYNDRQDIHTYFKNWVEQRGAEIDSTNGKYPVYFVLANGGASRSGYWTASVLGKLEDTTYGKSSQFSRHLFCLSGTSGGGVGVATFFSLLHERKQLNPNIPVSHLNSARSFLKKDFLTYTLAHMLGPDYFKYIFHISNRDLPDRAGALEQTLEEGSVTVSDSLKVDMSEPFSSMLALNGRPANLPVLCINTTRMQDGNPAVVTNIRLTRDVFNNRVDVMDVLNDTLDMRLSTASILGARFPYISPAGRIDEVIPSWNRVNQNDSLQTHYFVDGGYFDNSGAGVVQEMIRAMANYAVASTDTVLKKRMKKLHFTVIHITNSPVGVAALNPVSPLRNDLMSPVLTILGAYDMQTTVNDRRLDNFLQDINRMGVCAGDNYYPVHLYLDSKEKKAARAIDPKFREVPYSMNWFISDTTLKRMDKRLQTSYGLDSLIRIMNKAAP